MQSDQFLTGSGSVFSDRIQIRILVESGRLVLKLYFAKIKNIICSYRLQY